MEKTIALDLGTNSIGWAIRDESKSEKQIIDAGVLVFEKGVAEVKGIETPKVAKRTDSRRKRRNYQARKYRKQALLALLIENEMCPLSIEELNRWRKYDNGRKYPQHAEFTAWLRLDFNADGHADYTNPYLLRASVVKGTEKDKYAVGRALYHLTQRRGFAGGKGENPDEVKLIQQGSPDKGTKGRDEIKKFLEEKTLSQVYSEIDPHTERIRNRYNLRSDVEKELQAICTATDINSSLQAKLNKAIIWQRPLRTQKGNVGKCTLEKGKKRCQVSHPYFELFRAWSLINNIKIRPKGSNKREERELNEAQRKLVYEEIFLRKTPYFDFKDIRKKLDKKEEFDFNYKDNQNISGCPVSAYLYNIFGPNWLTIKINKTLPQASKKDAYDIEDIWHIAATYDKEEKIKEFAEKKLHLNESNTAQFITLWKNIPSGYGNLSLNAIKKILPRLVEGLVYSEAVMTANLVEVLGKSLSDDERKAVNKKIKEEVFAYDREKELNNIVNSLIADHLDLPEWERFGYDETYTLDDSDKTEIEQKLISVYGEKTWNDLSKEKQAGIRSKVSELYLLYLQSPANSKKFIRTPRRDERIKRILTDEFGATPKALEKLYHHSDNDIYPQSKRNEEGKRYLNTPVPPANGFKNPMAMKTLHKLKFLMNYLLKTGNIDETTKVVIEVPRELTTANKRKAIETWQREREKQNVEFARAIIELNRDKHLELNPEDPENVDRFRLWFDQLQNRDEVYKNVQVLKSDIDKYRLWKEQKCRCMYTGNMINITELFSGNYDFEHTIPASMSFDNSLANRTVAEAYFNREVKKKRIPTELTNYESDTSNYKAIAPRLNAWEEKVTFLNKKIKEYARNAKNASTKDSKDSYIQKRHYYELELEYWQKKLWTFTTREFKAGWKNSQLVDTGIVSKYAFHYLKSVFDKVYVQKGEVTAIFRRIFEIQGNWEKKSREKHTHHAMDAATLTLIPTGHKREKTLQRYFEAQEIGNNYHIKPYEGFHQSEIKEIQEKTLINLLSENRSLEQSRKYVRIKGQKISNGAQNGIKQYQIATGDTVRGQLHEETFLGAIRKPKRDEAGKMLRDVDGKILQHENNLYVVRKPLVFKVNATSPGFKTIEEIEACIVDPYLFKVIEKQTVGKTFREALESGIWMLNKNGEQVNKIRHIRVYTGAKEPLEIKKHRDLNPNKNYKHSYYAENGENLACALYQKTIKDKKGNDKVERELEIISLKQAADLLSHGLLNNRNEIEILRKDKDGNVFIDEDGNKQHPYAILRPGLKVVFYDDSIQELIQSKNETDTSYLKRISYRLYYVVKFSGGRITFQHHLEARDTDTLANAYPKEQVFMIDEKGKEIKFGVGGTSGFTKTVSDALKLNGLNNYEPWPRLLYSKEWLDMAIEKIHFEIAPDGKIHWKI